MAAKTMYHFTGLLYLPYIMKEGINRGEVPTSRRSVDERPSAANLTSMKDPMRQSWYDVSQPSNKLKIRMTVEIDESELSTFEEIAQKYNTTEAWKNGLGNKRQRDTWFYAFGGVSLDRIVKVELDRHKTYRELSTDQVKQLISKIEEEVEEKLIVERTQTSFGTRFKPGFNSTWVKGYMEVPN